MTGLLNRVKCFTGATGSSDAAVGAAFSTKHMTPSEAGAVDGKSYVWLFEQGNDFELVRGSWTNSGGIAARATVLWSKIGGTVSQSKMTLAGSATVSIVAAAEDYILSQPPVAKSAGFTLGVGDRDTLFLCSGTFTIAAAAAATLGSLFKVKVVNVGTGSVTIDPNSSELVDGSATLILLPGESANIECDGTGFMTGRGHGSVPYDRSVTLSSGQQGTAQNNLGGTTVGKALFTATDAAAARTVVIGATRTITGTDTIVASDIGKTLLFNSATAFTLAVTAAATLGNGFWCQFKNINVALVTIDPNSSETIDGATTTTVPKFDSGMIVCDGTSFYTINRPTEVIVESGVLSNTASKSFALVAGFSHFTIKYSCYEPVTSGASLVGRISTDGGSNYPSSLYLYGGVFGSATAASGGTTFSSGATGAAYFSLTAGPPTGSTAGAVGKIEIFHPEDSSYYHRIIFESATISGGVEYYKRDGGTYPSNAPWTHFQILTSSGNINNLRYTLRGHR